MKHFIIYLIIINVVTFCLYGADKRRARRKMWRVPEAVLLLFGLLGGSIGAGLAMHFLRHKTQHKKFTIGVPLIFILHVAVAVFLYVK